MELDWHLCNYYNLVIFSDVRRTIRIVVLATVTKDKTGVDQENQILKIPGLIEINTYTTLAFELSSLAVRTFKDFHSLLRTAKNGFFLFFSRLRVWRPPLNLRPRAEFLVAP